VTRVQEELEELEEVGEEEEEEEEEEGVEEAHWTVVCKRLASSREGSRFLLRSMDVASRLVGTGWRRHSTGVLV